MTSVRRRLRLSQFCGSGQAFHLARCDYTQSFAIRAHRHDFAEVFWVTAGRGMHTINDQRQLIATGDIIMIRPDDEHALAARAGESFTIINLAFAQSVVQDLRQRYAPDAPSWPWCPGPMPRRQTVDHATLAMLNEEAARLDRSPNNRLYLDAFLLRLVAMVEQGDCIAASRRPRWLTAALAQMDHAEHLRGGAAALATLCDRSIEHVNRVIRKHMNCTTSELINELRLDRAARQLRMSDRSISQIAMDCGYENLGYFYRCFKQRFDQTPRRYRTSAQAVAR